MGSGRPTREGTRSIENCDVRHIAVEVTLIQEWPNMQEQQAKNARLIGYALGAVVAAIALTWKFFAR